MTMVDQAEHIETRGQRRVDAMACCSRKCGRFTIGASGILISTTPARDSVSGADLPLLPKPR